MKKIISAILVLAMCVSLMGGITAGAVDAETDGSVIYGFSLKDTNFTNKNYGYKNGADTTDSDYDKTKPGVFQVGGFNDHGWMPLAVWYEDDVNPTLRMFEMSEKPLRFRERHADFANTVESAAIETEDILKDGVEFAFALDAPATAGYYSVSTSIHRAGVGLYMGNYKNNIVPENYKADFSAYMTDSYYLGDSKANNSEFSSTDGSLGASDSTGKVIYSDGSTDLFFGVDIPNLSNDTNPHLGVILRAVKLTPATGTAKVTKGTTNLKIGETTTASVKLGSAPVLGSTLTWTSSNACATVENGVITANYAGKSLISVYAGKTLISNWTVRVLSPEFVEAFDTYTTTSETVNVEVNTSVIALDGTVPEVIINKAEASPNGKTYLVTTDETVGDYKFLYWVKALELKKKIVSFDAEFTYTPVNGNNILVAVYCKGGDVAGETEYYNANGQRLDWDEGDPMPVMAGFDHAAKGWQDNGNGVKVAEYGEVQKFSIKVGDDVESYAYGDIVTCTATERDGFDFWGWQKRVNGKAAELVSTNYEYKFRAWESCEVTPLYKAKGTTKITDGITMRRVLVGTFTVGGMQAIMAEFIGFDDAAERGIMIGNKSYAMTMANTDEEINNQFTIINDNDQGATISGYALMSNGVKYIYTYTEPESEE